MLDLPLYGGGKDEAVHWRLALGREITGKGAHALEAVLLVERVGASEGLSGDELGFAAAPLPPNIQQGVQQPAANAPALIARVNGHAADVQSPSLRVVFLAGQLVGVKTGA